MTTTIYSECHARDGLPEVTREGSSVWIRFNGFGADSHSLVMPIRQARELNAKLGAELLAADQQLMQHSQDPVSQALDQTGSPKVASLVKNGAVDPGHPMTLPAAVGIHE